MKFTCTLVQVRIAYGKFPNSTLLLDFGFSLPYNSHDEVSFEFQFCDGSCLQKGWLLNKPDGFACKLYLSTDIIWCLFVLLRASGSLALFFLFLFAFALHYCVNMGYTVVSKGLLCACCSGSKLYQMMLATARF